jgi:hypothetical protein
MWSLRWSEKPEERDRNPSSPQISVIGVMASIVGSNPTGQGSSPW